MSKILWNELKTLYTELNTQRKKFQMSTVAVPSKENEQTKVTDISDLKDAIQAMTAHAQIGNEASTTSVIVPDQYSQMRQTPITQMRTVINRISNLSFNGSNFSGFNPNGSNFGSTFDPNGFNFSGFNPNGFNFSGFDPDSSNFTNVRTNGSFFSGFNPNSSLFSGHDSSRSSNFVMVTYGFNFTGNTPSFSGNFSSVRVCGRGVCFNGGAIN